MSSTTFGDTTWIHYCGCGAVSYGVNPSLPYCVFCPIDLTKTVLECVKCDCGSDSVGSNRHSSYCPKYEVR